MLFGVARTERVLGLHPKPCRACRPACDRLVTSRRWAFEVLGVPIVALDARWRRCTGCRRRAVAPRLTVPTAVLATLVLAGLIGWDLVSYGDLFLWLLLIGFWGAWLLGQVVDSFLERQLVPIPAALYRPARPVKARAAASRRATRSLAKGRPVRRIRAVVRTIRVPLRVLRRIRAERQRAPDRPSV